MKGWAQRSRRKNWFMHRAFDSPRKHLSFLSARRKCGWTRIQLRGYRPVQQAPAAPTALDWRWRLARAPRALSTPGPPARPLHHAAESESGGGSGAGRDSDGRAPTARRARGARGGGAEPGGRATRSRACGLRRARPPCTSPSPCSREREVWRLAPLHQCMRAAGPAAAVPCRPCSPRAGPGARRRRTRGRAQDRDQGRTSEAPGAEPLCEAAPRPTQCACARAEESDPRRAAARGEGREKGEIRILSLPLPLPLPPAAAGAQEAPAEREVPAPPRCALHPSGAAV
jgi:hypothetical protein